MTDEWKIPPRLITGPPNVIPGVSGGKVVEGDFPLDQVVIDKLPPGTVVHACNLLSQSEWTVAAKIDTTLAGEAKAYFLKCAEYDQGRAMLESEFLSMDDIHKVSENFVPKSYGWGQLSVSEPKTYFYIRDLLDLKHQDPDPMSLCKKLVTLHKSSESPTGMFGFPIKPVRGNLPLETSWNQNWSKFFEQLFRGSLALDEKINGPWKDLGHLVDLAMSHVVPQLLGPLEAEGRSIKPSLIHGDLWEGNIGTDPKTGEIYIFDASSYYAHHEMELGMWRPLPNLVIGREIYMKEYLSQMGVSEPAEHFEDRHRLYSACTSIHAAACHNRDSNREETYRKLMYLLDKYAPNIEETAAEDA
ncbi:uncharacterized protein RAG0_13675 [Rhynchosporium agropyri]|uniref:protein-ribulosamine 3-kinase n=1 Tax=Rhynchosporium agropyri TaxID=914238 RepID=A0A1E1LDQ4_9HELO|nr:uncharacterized protein RAG0_13675 [Rhynchosporium agropyri]